MKKYNLIFMYVISSLFGITQSRATTISGFDTLNKYLVINFIYSPNSGKGYKLSLTELRQNKFTSAHWAKAPFCKKFMQTLLLPPDQGGDQRLQDYVAYVLLLTKQKIQFNLINDGNIALSQTARDRYGICDWTDNNIPMVNKSWPCARTIGHPSTFSINNCTAEPASQWGGEFSMGEAYLSYYDSNQDYVRGTIVHELVHTQDWTDASWQHYNTTAGFVVYGRDGTHYYEEILPSKEYTFMEGLANSISLNYEKGIDLVSKKIIRGDTFMVEIPPSPLVARNTCGKIVPLSPNVSIYTQLINSGIAAINIANIKNPQTNYSYFATKTLRAKDLFFHNETVLACIIGKCLQYTNQDRFLGVYNAENMVRNFLNALDPSPFFGTLKTLSRSLVSKEIGMQLREMEELRVAPPDQCFLPYALIDVMTYGKLADYKEWKEFFDNRVTDYWINHYLRIKSTKLLDKDGKFLTDPDAIAKALGNSKVGFN